MKRKYVNKWCIKYTTKNNEVVVDYGPYTSLKVATSTAGEYMNKHDSIKDWEVSRLTDACIIYKDQQFGDLYAVFAYSYCDNHYRVVMCRKRESGAHPSSNALVFLHLSTDEMNQLSKTRLPPDHKIFNLLILSGFLPYQTNRLRGPGYGI